MKGNILVVDDEQIILKSCKRVLSSDGYEVKTATSAEEAIDLLYKSTYDLIITVSEAAGNERPGIY